MPITIEVLRNQFGQGLSEEEQAHIEEIIEDTAVRLYAKYAKGVREHGGGLWKKPIVDEIENETLDLLIYSHTLKRQLNESGVVLGDPSLSD